MVLSRQLPREVNPRTVVLALAVAALLPGLLVCAAARAADTLRIGTSGNLAPERAGTKEEAALETLQQYIKSDAVGFDNHIDRLKDWRAVADKLANKQLEIGAFQGYEIGRAHV